MSRIPVLLLIILATYCSCNEKSTSTPASVSTEDSSNRSGIESFDCTNGRLDSGYLSLTDEKGIKYYSKVVYTVCNGICIYDGDIVINPIHDTSVAQLVRPNNVKKWEPGAIVYYIFDTAFTRQSGRDTVEDAMTRIWLATGVEFKPGRKGGSNVKPVLIADDGQWRGNIGYGEHDTCHINLRFFPKAEIKGKIMHELLHILGFLHEQSRPDRDTFIDTANVEVGQEKNFRKLEAPKAITYGDYDFNSIMHYGTGQYTDMARVKNKPVITVKSQYASRAKAMGQRDSLTQNDIYSIRKFYNLTAN